MTIKIGRPEDAPKKVAKPHRCNDRVEDVIQALFEGFGDYRNTLRPAWSVMWRCFRSNEGEEPADPFLYVTPSNPAFQGEKRGGGPSGSKKGESVWSDEFRPDDNTPNDEKME
ncbi:hypothetical protein BSKO_09315 [Bryopsis sp. KO-2023]|nr:hypothetical protein BSKO_09315 [Bryopsis sp. KO-2023]